MPSIGLVIPEITCEMLEFWDILTNTILLSKTNARVVSVNTYYANYFFSKIRKVNILEFGDYILNPHEKCIQMSPNMPCIGSIICEIRCDF